MRPDTAAANPGPAPAGWNWGAFLLNWIWGIGNRTYIAFLMFVPLVNFVMPFVLGVKGNQWAWENESWESVEQFRRVQRRWAIAGVIAWIGMFGLVLLLWFGLLALMKGNEAYRLGMERIEANPQVIAALGSPLETGFVQGSIESSNYAGNADIHIPLSGPRGEGVAHVIASKSAAGWALESVEVYVEGTGQSISVR